MYSNRAFSESGVIPNVKVSSLTPRHVNTPTPTSNGPAVEFCRSRKFSRSRTQLCSWKMTFPSWVFLFVILIIVDAALGTPAMRGGCGSVTSDDSSGGPFKSSGSAAVLAKVGVDLDRRALARPEFLTRSTRFVPAKAEQNDLRGPRDVRIRVEQPSR